MITYIKLFLEFFHIGLFSFGGGYATLPFLYHIADVQKWYTTKQLADMIAVSSITPGPVGVNVATFAGFTTGGVLGALILIIIISKLLEQFRQNKYVQSVIYTLKPAGCGLLAAVGVDMFINNINIFGMVLLVGLFIASITEKRDPLFYIAVSAFVGLVAGFFNLTGN